MGTTATALHPAGAGEVPPRAAVPPEQTWDLARVFPDAAAWEAAFAAAEARLPELAAHRGRLGDSPAVLLAALRLRDELSEAVERVAVWAGLRLAEDAGDGAASAMADRGTGLGARLAAAAAFLDAELLALPPATVEAALAAEPGLAPYRHALDHLARRRAHVRSAEVEEVLAQAAELGAVPAAVHTALEDADLDLGTIRDERDEPVRLAQANLQGFGRSPDRRVRRAAWETSADAYLGLRHAFAAALAGGVKRDVFLARARAYPSALEAALAPDAIPPAVFHTLLDVVWRNLPVWHRYFRVRRRLLGLPEGDLHAWDLTAPLVAEEPVVPFAEGMALIEASLAPMGAEYVATVRQGIADRWVDRCANRGKGGGAFSYGSYRTLPYISMVYRDDLPSVSTLAHELGHSMHSWLAWQHTPITYWPYAMFTAETASNLHQALLGAHLLEHRPDRDWQIAVVEERMGNFLRYLFTMPILARFELDCHERVERGEALTADGMGATLSDLYRQGYGGEVAHDEARMGVTWARFSHLFHNFYVFQYATGIAAAAALADQIREEGDPAARRAVALLRAGGDGYPIDLLRDAGVDMLSPEPIQRAYDLLAGYVDRLEAFVET